MKTTILFALLALAFGASATPSEPLDTPAGAAVTAADDKPGEDDETVVCERRKVLGSNRHVRQCMTIGERKVAKEKAQGDLHRLGRCSGNDSVCAGSQ